jgi:ribosomal protein S11
MKSSQKSASFLYNNIRLKKKSVYSKKVVKYTSELKNLLVDKKQSKKLTFSPEKKSFNRHNSLSNIKKKSFMVVYSICFSFSPVNTFLYVTDALGNLKFRYSAGILEFKGKLKKNRFQVLNSFFKILQKLKMGFLKNKPIALHLNNVGSFKYFIIRNLKRNFFIRLVKNYQTHSYNGCRKKKKRRR